MGSDKEEKKKAKELEKATQKEYEKLDVCISTYNAAIVKFFSAAGFKRLFGMAKVEDVLRNEIKGRLKNDTLSVTEREALEKINKDYQKAFRKTLLKGIAKVAAAGMAAGFVARSPRLTREMKEKAKGPLDELVRIFNIYVHSQMTPTDAYVLFRNKVVPMPDNNVMLLIVPTTKEGGPDYSGLASRVKDLRKAFEEAEKAFNAVLPQLQIKPEDAMQEIKHKQEIIPYLIEIGEKLTSNQELPKSQDYSTVNIANLCDSIEGLPGQMLKSLVLNGIHEGVPPLEEVVVQFVKNNPDL